MDNLSGDSRTEIKCPACAEIIQVEAKKCKHCGEVIEGSKKVGPLLGIGIFFMPYVFSWITLKKGYAKTTRAFSFIWLVIVCAIVFGPNKKHAVNEVIAPKPDVPQSVEAVESIWKIRYYVDDFGDPTKNGYITNSQDLSGHFSNSATTDSPLLINFLIDKSNKISIQLYEYARKNPVKSYGEDHYSILIKDKNDKKYNVSGTNYSDRIMFDPSAAKQLHGILKMGGKVSFLIAEKRNSITTYNFTISNADGYAEKYEELRGR